MSCWFIFYDPMKIVDTVPNLDCKELKKTPGIMLIIKIPQHASVCRYVVSDIERLISHCYSSVLILFALKRSISLYMCSRKLLGQHFNLIGVCLSYIYLQTETTLNFSNNNPGDMSKF